MSGPVRPMPGRMPLVEPGHQGPQHPRAAAIGVALGAQLAQVRVAVAVEAARVVRDEQRQAFELVGVEVVVTAVRSRQAWHVAQYAPRSTTAQEQVLHRSWR